MTCTNTPTDAVYNPTHELAQVVANCPSTGLPMTGLDIWLLIVGALVLIAIGVLLRKYANGYDGPSQA